MKKVKLLSVLLLSTIILGACSSNNKDKSDTTTENSASETTVIVTSHQKKDVFKETTLPVGGVVEYTITNITSEEINKKDGDVTNAEYNFTGFDNFPDVYFRSLIEYKLKNTSDKPLSLSSFNKSIVDGNGNQFDFTAGEFFLLDANSNGSVQPNASASGTFNLLSKEKPNLDRFSINIDRQYSNDSDHSVIGEPSTIEYEK